MTQRERQWERVEAARLRALLGRAPVHMALLVGRDLRLEAGDEDLVLLLRGEERPAGEERGPPALRERMGETLGPMWLEAMDRVRRSGGSHRATHRSSDGLWDLRLERLDPERIAVYARRVVDEVRRRELLHSLRNPIYGIRSASRILLRRDLSAEAREVLAEVESAAAEAERRLQELEDA